MAHPLLRALLLLLPLTLGCAGPTYTVQGASAVDLSEGELLVANDRGATLYGLGGEALERRQEVPLYDASVGSVSLDAKRERLTLRSGRRVQVYDWPSGERRAVYEGSPSPDWRLDARRSMTAYYVVRDVATGQEVARGRPRVVHNPRNPKREPKGWVRRLSEDLFGETFTDLVAGAFTGENRPDKPWVDEVHYLPDGRLLLVRPGVAITRAPVLGPEPNQEPPEYVALAFPQAWWADAIEDVRIEGERIYFALRESDREGRVVCVPLPPLDAKAPFPIDAKTWAWSQTYPAGSSLRLSFTPDRAHLVLRSKGRFGVIDPESGTLIRRGDATQLALGNAHVAVAEEWLDTVRVEGLCDGLKTYEVELGQGNWARRLYLSPEGRWLAFVPGEVDDHLAELWVYDTRAPK